MNKFYYLFIPVLLLFSACSDKPTPQQATTVKLPSYAEAALAYQEKSRNENKKMVPEDLAVMKRSADSLAQRLPDPGIKLGATAPSFSLTDARGKQIALASLLKQGPVVLVFYRGAWCPYCNMHLRTLNQSLPEIKRLGAQLVAITPQKPDKSAAQLKESGYPFVVLSDLDSSVMKSYRLYYEMDQELIKLYNKLGLDVAKFNGTGRYVLPVPGTFVIDSKGIVRARHATTDYTQRMEPADIIKALEKLSG